MAKDKQVLVPPPGMSRLACFDGLALGRKFRGDLKTKAVPNGIDV
jgi:hypothetical protein